MNHIDSTWRDIGDSSSYSALDMVVCGVPDLSLAAIRYLNLLSDRYVAAPDSNVLRWYFDAGKSTPVHQELEASGYLSRMLGTKKGFSWCFTDSAERWIAAREVRKSELAPTRERRPSEPRSSGPRMSR